MLPLVHVVSFQQIASSLGGTLLPAEVGIRTESALGPARLLILVVGDSQVPESFDVYVKVHWSLLFLARLGPLFSRDAPVVGQQFTDG